MLTYALKTYMKFDHQSGIDIECSTLKIYRFSIQYLHCFRYNV